MDLRVAHRAITEPRTAETVKSGRNAAESIGDSDVGVAFQADEALLVPDQHSGIDRAVRLVTARTPPQPKGSVLKREWAPFVAMAFKAPRLIGESNLHRSGQEAAMWVMTIDAGHCPLRQPVLKWPLKLFPGRGMALNA